MSRRRTSAALISAGPWRSIARLMLLSVSTSLLIRLLHHTQAWPRCYVDGLRAAHISAGPWHSIAPLMLFWVSYQLVVCRVTYEPDRHIMRRISAGRNSSGPWPFSRSSYSSLHQYRSVVSILELYVSLTTTSLYRISAVPTCQRWTVAFKHSGDMLLAHYQPVFRTASNPHKSQVLASRSSWQCLSESTGCLKI